MKNSEEHENLEEVNDKHSNSGNITIGNSLPRTPVQQERETLPNKNLDNTKKVINFDNQALTRQVKQKFESLGIDVPLSGPLDPPTRKSRKEELTEDQNKN